MLTTLLFYCCSLPLSIIIFKYIFKFYYSVLHYLTSILFSSLHFYFILFCSASVQNVMFCFTSVQFWKLHFSVIPFSKFHFNSISWHFHVTTFLTDIGVFCKLCLTALLFCNLVFYSYFISVSFICCPFLFCMFHFSVLFFFLLFSLLFKLLGYYLFQLTYTSVLISKLHLI